jgi:hypothetical protein
MFSSLQGYNNVLTVKSTLYWFVLTFSSSNLIIYHYFLIFLICLENLNHEVFNNQYIAILIIFIYFYFLKTFYLFKIGFHNIF